MLFPFARWRMRQPLTPRSVWRRAGVVLMAVAALLLLYTIYLDFTIRIQFEGKRWALPARVYARPLELYPGMPLEPAALTFELNALNYRPAAAADRPGTYARTGDEFVISTRGFRFWDGNEPALKVRLVFANGQLSEIADSYNGAGLDLLRLDPVLIGSIYPSHNEDRILVKYDEVPPLLVQALVVMEDRHFFQHHGIMPSAIARAALANLKAGGIAQGGSTLTQQLVKNFFLSNERTVWRKANEAIMALLLEWHYSKEEILEAYLNEIYLGQDGRRSIHGFGLASQFYFGIPLADTQPDQIALLVALVRGASYYDPRRYAKRAKERRDLVLEKLAEQGLMDSVDSLQARGRPLGVLKETPSGVSPHPAFIELVRHQLHRDYREKDLTSEGLQIFTTLDPLVQHRAEQAMVDGLHRMERDRGLPAGELQGVLIATSRQDGEVVAVVGDRQTRYAGFNRALNAERHIGSLIKPAIYLTALESRDYTLASLLPDEPLAPEQEQELRWQPKNYDGQTHGEVMLHQSLAHSYNLSTIHLGLGLGVNRVMQTLQRLGLDRLIDAYPSSLLGAVNLSPLEVTQVYQTFADGGFKTPLRAIRSVLTVEGQPLQRYGLEVEQMFDAESIYLVNTVMQEVVRAGTAQSVKNRLPEDYGLAGKTGTTDDLRDSWFAGFDGEHLAVAWVGYDDNRSTGLTGASGALTIWADFLGRIGVKPLQLAMPEGVELTWIDPTTQLSAVESCAGAYQLPFVRGTEPQEAAPCAQGVGGTVKKTLKWLQGIMK